MILNNNVLITRNYVQLLLINFLDKLRNKNYYSFRRIKIYSHPILSRFLEYSCNRYGKKNLFFPFLTAHLEKRKRGKKITEESSAEGSLSEEREVERVRMVNAERTQRVFGQPVVSLTDFYRHICVEELRFFSLTRFSFSFAFLYRGKRKFFFVRWE